MGYQSFPTISIDAIGIIHKMDEDVKEFFELRMLSADFITLRAATKDGIQRRDAEDFTAGDAVSDAP